MTDNMQTVVDTTKPVAQPTDAVDLAREDVDPLDKLLAEFDEQTRKRPGDTVTQPEPRTTPQLESPPPIDNNRLARIEQRLFQEDLNEAVTSIFGDMKVPRRVALGWLDQVARESPQVAQAFMNKSNDPKTWQRFAKSLSKEAAKDFRPSDVDENATADRAAVAQAVRTGSTTTVAPEPQPNLGQMSDAELRTWRLKTYGF